MEAQRHRGTHATYVELISSATLVRRFCLGLLGALLSPSDVGPAADVLSRLTGEPDEAARL